MKTNFPARTLSLLLALVLVPCTAVLAQEVEELIYVPSTRMQEAIHTSKTAEASPVQVTVLEQRDDHASILVRRTETAGPELHEAFDDVYIVHDGAATLVYGGTYEGAQTTEPGELRGGTITGGTSQPLVPGDIVVVPADVPHQVVIEPGKSVIYHVVKVRRGK